MELSAQKVVKSIKELVSAFIENSVEVIDNDGGEVEGKLNRDSMLEVARRI